ncbi:DNA-binding CsgD family transcriptional regulator/type II secretory pathway predicted ATPase ExeA [Arthrobacter sp. CAN_A2]|uniref:helix-turn-helix transcriptional regulator n=1 Tax=Arthrobacter sp. CAN_A2 TaxID=2787718 RepID=UPI0018F01297
MTEVVARGTWPLVGRSAETDRVTDALRATESSGVLLVGAAGQGKTAVARHAVNALSSKQQILYIRGSSLGAPMAYSALTVLLVDLDDEVARNPLVLLTALQTLFTRMPGGRPVVVVDNVEDLDPESATALAHLASTESVRLVVITEQIPSTPEPFLELWRNQVLVRVDIEPLTFEQTRDLLREVLGGDVSRALAVAMWRASDGKAGNLRTLVPLALETGQMGRRDGIWTQSHERPGNGVPGAGIGTSTLDAATGVARTALALLSVLEGLPVRMLLHHIPRDEVDALQQRGLIRVQWGDEPTAVIAEPFAATSFRTALARSPEPAILDALDEVERCEDLPPTSDVVLTEWLLDAGAVVPDQRLLRAAKHANQLALPRAARRVLAALDDWRQHPAGVIEYARLPLDHADARAVRSAIDTLLQDPDLTPACRTALRLEDARTRLRHAPVDDALLERLRLCEADCSAVQGEDRGHLGAELTLLRLELGLLEGRYSDVIRDASCLTASILDPSSAAVRAKGLLMIALAATGRHERADVLAEVLAQSPYAASHPRDQEEAHRGAVLSLALAGRLDEALERLRGVSSSQRDIQDEVWAEGLAGILLAGAGRSREALRLLLPAMAELGMEDRSGMLPAAEAAAAYAYALDGQDDAARGYLDDGRRRGRHNRWPAGRMVDYFSVLTAALLDDQESSAQAMLRSANAERALGGKGLELLFLLQAVRLGEASVAHRLLVRSGELPGPLAHLGHLFSKGVLAQDPALLLEAAEAALTAGHHDLAGSSSLLAVQLRARDDDPLIFVRAEQILRQTSVERRRSLTRQALTERERAVARMVARGASNKDIAAAEHLSIRTAEGYVHRAMAKLGVHNRKQLRSVFAKR